MNPTSQSVTGDGEWGHLAQFAEFASTSHLNKYKVIDFDESLTKSNITHASHCLIYSPWKKRVLGLYNPRAAILMQVRFDGYLGFPGGLVDNGETPIEAVNREMKEEINFNSSLYQVEAKHHIITHINEAMKLITHFYALPVSYEHFLAIEKACLEAEEYGEEVFGIVRPTLYTMGDNYRGFPAFLNHNFVGNSKEQLLEALRSCNIMTQEEISLAVNNSKKVE